MACRPPSRARSSARTVLAHGTRSAAALAVALALAAPLAAAPAKHGAAKKPAEVQQPLPTVTTTLWHKAQDVAIFALGLIGVDYKLGGESPQTGVDCSGLVHMHQPVDLVKYRAAADVGAAGRWRAGRSRGPAPVTSCSLNTRRFMNSHVGIYLGDNRFVHGVDGQRSRDLVAGRSLLAAALQRRAPADRRAAQPDPDGECGGIPGGVRFRRASRSGRPARQRWRHSRPRQRSPRWRRRGWWRSRRSRA